MTIRKVWIDEGCISCHQCECICPEVFHVEDDEECVVKPEADGLLVEKQQEILDASADCPVQVIRVEGADVPEIESSG